MYMPLLPFLDICYEFDTTRPIFLKVLSKNMLAAEIPNPVP
jgi:hypothetical protein